MGVLRQGSVKGCSDHCTLLIKLFFIVPCKLHVECHLYMSTDDLFPVQVYDLCSGVGRKAVPCSIQNNRDVK